MDGTVDRGTGIRVGAAAGMDAKVGAMRAGAAKEGMSTATTVAASVVERPSTVVAFTAVASCTRTMHSMGAVVSTEADSTEVVVAGKL